MKENTVSLSYQRLEDLFESDAFYIYRQIIPNRPIRYSVSVLPDKHYQFYYIISALDCCSTAVPADGSRKTIAAESHPDWTQPAYQMKYLFLIILFALTTNFQGPVNQRKSIKEKKEYVIEKQPDGSTLRKLMMTTTYTVDGKTISEIEACTDSNCCYYNNPFRLHKNKNEYWYKNDRLILRVFRTCDSMPSYKNFHEYKLDNKKRLIEEKEQTFSYETGTQKYEKGKWIPAKIGDSTLTEININQYTYDQFDNVIEEKVIIQKKYPRKEKVSWKVVYQYDKNKNLIKIEQPGAISVSENRYYDEKNRLIKIKSSLTGDNVTTDIEYGDYGNISRVREVINDKVVTTKYTYNNDNLLVSEESEGNKIKGITITYFYNEFNDPIRKETSFDNKPPFITEFEYTYF